MSETDYDICIIGGGVNGAGIARDAAGRGLKVLLVEAQDLASATSSASTKLIHGGLRYLEHYEFKLVRESLEEREVLLRNAPHIIWPMDFVLPHQNSVRPAWLIRLGLFLYDHLGGRKILKGSYGINLTKHEFGTPLKPLLKKAFTYQDCWVEDSRLVVLNAYDAKRLGADILTYTACIGLSVETPPKSSPIWHVSLQDQMKNDEFKVTAKAVINCGGPWVRGILEGSNLIDDENPAPKIRQVKGSHIIVPKLFEGNQAYILQQPDKRIVFAIPYEHKFTLIGTTDVDYHGNPSDAECSDDEMDYLCNAVNIYFQKQTQPSDVIWTYSGVRPLIDDAHGDASKVTRDYKFHIDTKFGPPILSVFGGKITTFRALSERAIDEMSAFLNMPKSSWTDCSPLPGGKIDPEKFEAFIESQIKQYHWLPADVVRRYARAYGMRMNKILAHATSPDQLGYDFTEGVFESEIIYSIHYEFSKTAEDFLWRRSKLGLHLKPETIEAIQTQFPDIYKRVKKYD